MELSRDRDERVVEREAYIAKTRGAREFPWRVLVVAEKDETLLDSDIVYRLATEYCAWPTRRGSSPARWRGTGGTTTTSTASRSAPAINTETYKHYIDFAAENGLDYIILDEGWYRLGDLLAVGSRAWTSRPSSSYGKQKNVGVILWVVWKTLDLQMQPALDQFEKWGVKGIKVDFMQREDQWMVNFYERTVREAAKRKLLVDFHGAYKPTGLYRTWPN